MAQLKDWLKARISTGQRIGDKEDVQSQWTACPIILTPNTVPEFKIPGNDVIPETEPDNPDTPRRSSSSHFLGVPRTQRSKSAPVSPMKAANSETPEEWFKHRNSTGEMTNADPRSLAAMELPHFQAKTSFGFDTLTQAPHTRRKESLFHAHPAAAQLSLAKLSFLDAGNDNCQGSKCDLLKRGTQVSMPTKRRQSQPLLVTPLGVPNRPRQAETLSPKATTPTATNVFQDQILPESLSSTDLDTRVTSSGKELHRSLSCRMQRCKSSSLGSSRRKTSLGFRHRERMLVDPQLQQLNRSFSLSTSRSPSSSANNNPLLDPRGSIELQMLYSSTERRLKVTLVKAEVHDLLIPRTMYVNAFARLCLLPGEIQRQTSKLCRNTFFPEFDQNFIFADVVEGNLRHMRLRVRLYHQSNGLRRSECLGEVQVGLKDVENGQDVILTQTLGPKLETEVIYIIGTYLTTPNVTCVVFFRF